MAGSVVVAIELKGKEHDLIRIWFHGLCSRAMTCIFTQSISLH